MLSPEMQTSLNNRLNEEQSAAQEYLAMAAWLEDHNFRGFAAFMRRQSDEERMHAMKFFDHIVDRSGAVHMGAISAPTLVFDSPLSVFEGALHRERANTTSINECYAIAEGENDYATQTFLHWFIIEQVEEEQWAEEAVGLLKTAGDDSSALLMLDNRYETFQTEV